MDFMQLIGQVAFPAAMCVFMGMFIKDTMNEWRVTIEDLRIENTKMTDRLEELVGTVQKAVDKMMIYHEQKEGEKND